MFKKLGKNLTRSQIREVMREVDADGSGEIESFGSHSHMSHSLNSLKGGYIGDYMGNYYGAY